MTRRAPQSARTCPHTHEFFPQNIYGVSADQNLTNVQLYDLMNPLYDKLPYIYDSFTWKHCAEATRDNDDPVSFPPVQST